MSDYSPINQLIDTRKYINLREMGGMPLSDGKTFKSGLYLRGGSPCEWSDAALAEYKLLGIHTVIDLRSADELNKYGNPLKDMEDIEFYSMPLFTGDPIDPATSPDVFLREHKLGDIYIEIIEGLSDTIADIMRILTTAPNKILFHCAHGKDRTGIIAAFLYLLAGANRDDIINNYKVSYDYNKWFFDPLINELTDERLHHKFRSDAENMEILLDYINERYSGDITIYLKSKGMSENEIFALRNKIVE